MAKRVRATPASLGSRARTTPSRTATSFTSGSTSDHFSHIKLLSAAKRGRGRGPLQSNGKVRWCFVKRDARATETPRPPHPLALRAGPSLSPHFVGGEGRRDERLCPLA